MPNKFLIAVATILCMVVIILTVILFVGKPHEPEPTVQPNEDVQHDGIDGFESEELLSRKNNVTIYRYYDGTNECVKLYSVKKIYVVCVPTS